MHIEIEPSVFYYILLFAGTFFIPLTFFVYRFAMNVYQDRRRMAYYGLFSNFLRDNKYIVEGLGNILFYFIGKTPNPLISFPVIPKQPNPDFNKNFECIYNRNNNLVTEDGIVRDIPRVWPYGPLVKPLVRPLVKQAVKPATIPVTRPSTPDFRLDPVGEDRFNAELAKFNCELNQCRPNFCPNPYNVPKGKCPFDSNCPGTSSTRSPPPTPPSPIQTKNDRVFDYLLGVGPEADILKKNIKNQIQSNSDNDTESTTSTASTDIADDLSIGSMLKGVNLTIAVELLKDFQKCFDIDEIYNLAKKFEDPQANTIDITSLSLSHQSEFLREFSRNLTKDPGSLFRLPNQHFSNCLKITCHYLLGSEEYNRRFINNNTESGDKHTLSPFTDLLADVSSDTKNRPSIFTRQSQIPRSDGFAEPFRVIARSPVRTSSESSDSNDSSNDSCSESCKSPFTPNNNN